VLVSYEGAIAEADVLSQLGLEPRGYFLVTMHGEENVDVESCLEALVSALPSPAREVRPAGVCKVM
jgi:UDP-N-acetylglucosamine 2-epimerase